MSALSRGAGWAQVDPWDNPAQGCGNVELQETVPPPRHPSPSSSRYQRSAVASRHVQVLQHRRFAQRVWTEPGYQITAEVGTASRSQHPLFISRAAKFDPESLPACRHPRPTWAQLLDLASRACETCPRLLDPRNAQGSGSAARQDSVLQHCPRRRAPNGLGGTWGKQGPHINHTARFNP